jgi:Chaperone of endosialidase
MKKMHCFLVSFLLCYCAHAQNVGIGIPLPTERLHVDSGSIKIGNFIFAETPVHPFLKFGDGNYITIGEEEADDNLTIRAKELLIRPSTTYTTVPLSIQGTNNYSHFYFGSNEDTYIRGGKTSSNLILGDGGGRTGINAYPQRAMLEQNGSVGTTAAIFGGDGAGISLQKNWPVVGFNHYYDGVNHKAIGQGYNAILGVNQNTGNLYMACFKDYAAIPNANLTGYTERIYFSRFGKIGLGTEDPQSDLHIVQASNTKSSGIRLDYSNSGNFSSWNIYTQTGLFLSAGSDFYSHPLFFESNSGAAGAIGNNGNYYQASDQNLKKDIHYLQSDHLMNTIMQLAPARYLFNSDKNEQPLHYGFIAQDIEKLFPDFVLTTEKGLKLVSYTGLIPILTKGMQEQQQQIETLQQENKSLNARLGRLEKMMLNN